jgi:hypothetical protein
LSSAWQTAFVPLSEDEDDSLGSADGDPPADPDGDSVDPGLPPGCTASAARLPRPEIVFAQPATDAAASSAVRAARARRASIGASSSVTTSGRRSFP